MSCNTQNNNSITTMNKILQNQKSYELIGIKTIDNISYRSFYTQVNIKEVVHLYHRQLIMESSRVNIIALFYDERQHTPTTSELNNQEVTLNKNLIGGIERQEGKYFILLKNDNQLLTREILTID